MKNSRLILVRRDSKYHIFSDNISVAAVSWPQGLLAGCWLAGRQLGCAAGCAADCAAARVAGLAASCAEADAKRQVPE